MRIWAAINLTLLIVSVVSVRVAVLMEDKETSIEMFRLFLLVVASIVVQGLVIVWRWAL